MSDFKDMIASNFPAAGAPKKAPPPLPPKKQAPPLPPKKVDSLGFSVTQEVQFDTGTAAPVTDAAARLRAIAAELPAALEPAAPVAEKGFINPPDSPAVLAATPEEAIAVQGIVAPAEPVADELDGMTKAQLLAECQALGIGSDATKGKRETGLRKLIRDARANEPKQMVTADRDGTLAEAIVETTEALVSVGLIDATTANEITAPLTEEKPEMTKSDKPKFTLFINARQDGSKGLEQFELVAEGNRLIKEQSGLEDFRAVDYGKGPMYLCQAVKHALEEGKFEGFGGAVHIDTRTPEGQALVTTLAALAGAVIRGL